MDVLKSKDLLLIAPHFKTFIREQATLIRPFLNDMYVLIPMPYFSNVALHLPYLRRHFGFLRVITESNEDMRDCNVISPKFFTLPVEALRKRNPYLAARSCIKALSQNTLNFNLIHAHFLEEGFIGANLKSLYDKPFVVTAHGGDVYDLPFRDSWYNALARYVLNEADQVITVSKSNQEKLLSLGVYPSKLHVIPNGYDEKLFKLMPSIEARKRLGLPLNKKLLLSVGNLVAVKGHTYLLDAMKFVLKRRDDVILLIVGSGPLRENLCKKTRELNLERNVFFVGGKKHEEIPFWMNACDVFVLPSLMESFGVVSVESMACGKPVVGTCVGGIPEIVRKHDVGILVKPADPKALSDGILEALDRTWVAEVVLNYAKQYSWTNIVGRILKIYREVLQNQT